MSDSETSTISRSQSTSSFNDTGATIMSSETSKSPSSEKNSSIDSTDDETSKLDSDVSKSRPQTPPPHSNVTSSNNKDAITDSEIVPTSATESSEPNSQGNSVNHNSTNSTVTSATDHADEFYTPASHKSIRTPTSTRSPDGSRTESKPIDPVILQVITNTEAQNMALDFFHGTANFITTDNYASWMGDEGTLQADTRSAYMELFSWTGKSILGALRDLCDRLYMKGESQQLNRLMESFSNAWFKMNPQNGFYDSNVVYTIAYALLLLNTDLYAADHTNTKKISKSKFVSNTIESIKTAHAFSKKANETSEKSRNEPISASTKTTTSDSKASEDVSTPLPNLNSHNNKLENRKSSFSYSSSTLVGTSFKEDTTVLVNGCPVAPLTKEWYFTLESVLKVYYTSVYKDALELYRAEEIESQKRLQGVSSMSSRANSVSTTGTSLSQPYGSGLMPSISMTPSLRASSSTSSSSSSILGRLTGFNRLRPGRHSHHDFNQSRIDFGSDFGHSASRSNTGTDTFRRDSFGSLFSMESSFSGFHYPRQAVGFAGLLLSSMNKDDDAASNSFPEDSFADFSQIEAELAKEVELELHGAPWAKEGLLKYRPYIDPSTGKKSKRKDWMEVFVVVQRGQLKMFSFDTKPGSATVVNSSRNINSLSRYNKDKKSTVDNVGAGNWMEKATLVDGYHLCHTMAQELPPTKKTRGFSSLWSLTLPQQGVLVFEAGTREIAKEYVYTCNYWAGRLSKEPFDEPVSSMEYGWGHALEALDTDEPTANSTANVGATVTNSSTSSSASSSSNNSNRYPGDKVTIREWRPSSQSLIVSDLNEETQYQNLKDYLISAEKNLYQHNVIRSKLSQAYSPNSSNLHKAFGNWERKSQYLLQQLVRYKIYVEALERAIKDKKDYDNDDKASSSDVNNNNTTTSISSSTVFDSESYNNKFSDDADSNSFGEIENRQKSPSSPFIHHHHQLETLDEKEV